MSEDALPGGWVWTRLGIAVKKPQISVLLTLSVINIITALGYDPRPPRKRRL